jgi:hypothetical protein
MITRDYLLQRRAVLERTLQRITGAIQQVDHELAYLDHLAEQDALDYLDSLGERGEHGTDTKSPPAGRGEGTA